MANGVRKRRRWLGRAIVVVLVGWRRRSWSRRRGGAGPQGLDPSLITTVKRGDLRHRGARDRQGAAAREGRGEVQGGRPGAQGVRRRGRQGEEGAARCLQLDPTDYERRACAKAEAERRPRAQNALEFAELTLERRQKGLAEAAAWRRSTSTPPLSDVQGQEGGGADGRGGATTPRSRPSCTTRASSRPWTAPSPSAASSRARW